MPLYFAYGSNMDRAAMAQRCPRSTEVGLARLARHRFAIVADGYASVVRDPHRSVWGMLWDLAFGDVAALDRYEDIGAGLYVKATQPVLAAGGAKRALIYLARDARPGAPRPGYLEGVVAAAREAGLPGDYLRELEALLPGRAAGPPAPVRPVRPTREGPPSAGGGRAKPWS
jgi:AIG2-like family